VAAALVEVRAGFRSWDSVVAETGYNPDDVLAAIEARNKKFDDAGVVLDSDPRHVSQAGQVQQEPADEPDDTKEEV
jgi:capsid protein